MAKLIHSTVTSLDGHAEAEDGLGTGADDPKVHSFIDDLFRPAGTYLYGRRMYETMVHWETRARPARPAAAHPAVRPRLAGCGGDRALHGP